MPAPTVTADTFTTYQGVSAIVSVLANDSANGGPALNTAGTQVRFSAAGQPTDVVVAADRLLATKVGVGRWEVITSGLLTNVVFFSPHPEFSGVAPAIKYTVTNTEPSESAETTVTVTVRAAVSLAGITRTQGATADGKRYVEVAYADLPAAESTTNNSVSYSAASLGLGHVERMEWIWPNTVDRNGLFVGTEVFPQVLSGTPTAPLAVRFVGR